jgi:hypothetical protein
LELIKDYDLEIHYHPIIRVERSMFIQLLMPSYPMRLLRIFRRLNLGIVARTEGVIIDVEPILDQEIHRRPDW